MLASVGRVWGWINPGNLYRPWAANHKCEKPLAVEGQEQNQTSSWTLGRLTSWVWGGWRNSSDQKTPEEFWEAQEEFHKHLEIEDLNAEMTHKASPPLPALQSSPRWWSRMYSSGFQLWQRLTDASGNRQRNEWDPDDDLSDYDTPPPSPKPLSQTSSTFRFFASSWSGDILPEHYEICFNFLRHLFDLFVVGFLWTVSPPAKFILDVLGVQGALKLWLHGIAMFLVASVGMAGLLWVVQEYLPHFALVYGIIQALVISVSVRQNLNMETGDEEKGAKEEDEDEMQDEWEQDQTNESKRMNWS